MNRISKEHVLLNYCQTSNFLQALQNISVELTIVGLPEVSMYCESNPVPTIVQLVNTIWTLLRQRQRLVDDKRALDSNLFSIVEELNSLKEKQIRTEKELQRSADDFTTGRNANIVLKMDNLGEKKRIKYQNKEIQDLKTELKKQEMKFKQAYTKQEQEMFLLQAKLKDISVDYEVQKWRHSKGSNLKKKPDTFKPEFDAKEEWYKKCLYRLESNVQSLVKENLDLKKLLEEMTDDLSVLFTRKKQPKPRRLTIDYADDCQLHMPFGMNGLEEAIAGVNSDLENIREWSRKHGLKLNATKCTVLYIAAPTQLQSIKDSNGQIVIGNESLSVSDTVKTHGVVLDSGLSFTDHVTYVLLKKRHWAK